VGAASWRSRIFWDTLAIAQQFRVQSGAYLDVARHVVLYGLECCGTQEICSMSARDVIESCEQEGHTEQCGQALSGFEELCGGNSIVLGSIDRDVLPALLDTVEESCHDVWLCFVWVVELYKSLRYRIRDAEEGRSEVC
jgi:hypothetical protein